MIERIEEDEEEVVVVNEEERERLNLIQHTQEQLADETELNLPRKP